MSLVEIALLLAGFVALVGGAEFLVKGASNLAVRIGVSPLVVGLTVVAFGTSSPELAVSALSANSGQAGLALGNVVGSNICNVLLILGLSALVAPLSVSRQVIRLEVPIMIGASILLFLFAVGGEINRLEGIALFLSVIVYTAWTIRRSRRETTGNGRDEQAPEKRSCLGIQVLEIVGGLLLLGIGSKWLIDGAAAAARLFGVSDLVIGLTVVAVGTSLPELATSVLASVRGQRDIAVGNVVGSNIFNILAVLGITAALAPNGIPVPSSALDFDLPVMLAASIACLPIFFTGRRIARWEGGLFFGYYLAYAAYVVLTALHDGSISMFAWAMTGFILPLTVLTLAVSFWRNVHSNRRQTTGDR